MKPFKLCMVITFTELFYMFYIITFDYFNVSKSFVFLASSSLIDFKLCKNVDTFWFVVVVVLSFYKKN